MGKFLFLLIIFCSYSVLALDQEMKVQTENEKQVEVSALTFLKRKYNSFLQGVRDNLKYGKDLIFKELSKTDIFKNIMKIVFIETEKL